MLSDRKLSFIRTVMVLLLLSDKVCRLFCRLLYPLTLSTALWTALSACLLLLPSPPAFSSCLVGRVLKVIVPNNYLSELLADCLMVALVSGERESEYKAGRRRTRPQCLRLGMTYLILK